jgi:DHA1 family bicyclomycin/chloramphenicol resistance-like MFS transporter
VTVITLIAITFFLEETKGPDESVKFSRTFHTYLDVLKDQTFLAFTIPLSFVYAGMFAYITGSPFVFIEHFGFTPSQYSMLFGVNAFGLIAFSQLNSRLLRRYTPETMIAKSLPITATAGFILFLTGFFHLPVWMICPALFIFILTMGTIAPNAAACALANQKKTAGSASALMGTIQFTVSALCSSLVSKLHNGTVMPMMIVMFGCSLVAVVLFVLLRKKIVSSSQEDMSL